jgi:type II secretory pathway component PulJ
MKDWLATSEQQLKQRDDSIRVLNAQIDGFKALQLPVEQITSEVQAQWPQIESVTLARNDEQIVLLIHAKPKLKEDDQQRITHWLAVRLKADNVLVVAQ